LGYSGIRIYSRIYSSYSAPGSRIGGIEIQVFRNGNSSQTNAYSHYSNYSYSRLIPNERALSDITNKGSNCMLIIKSFMPSSHHYQAEQTNAAYWSMVNLCFGGLNAFFLGGGGKNVFFFLFLFPSFLKKVFIF